MCSSRSASTCAALQRCTYCWETALNDIMLRPICKLSLNVACVQCFLLFFLLQFLGTRHCFSLHIVEFTVVWIFQCTCLRMYSCTAGKCCTEKLKGEAWKWIIVLPLRAASVIHLIYLQYHSGCNSCSICRTFVLLFFFHENILGQNIILETDGTG